MLLSLLHEAVQSLFTMIVTVAAEYTRTQGEGERRRAKEGEGHLADTPVRFSRGRVGGWSFNRLKIVYSLILVCVCRRRVVVVVVEVMVARQRSDGGGGYTCESVVE